MRRRYACISAYAVLGASAARARFRAAGGLAYVGLKAGVDGLAAPALERPDRDGQRLGLLRTGWPHEIRLAENARPRTPRVGLPGRPASAAHPACIPSPVALL